MDEEIEVANSEENGNVAVDTEETPSEQPQEAENTAEEQPAEPSEPELFELPDGRKVDAETLTKEWKENFMPDYTKKATALKEIEKNNQTPENPLADPNYQPSNYDELAQQIEARTLAKIEAKEQAQIEARQARENTVIAQLEEVKKLDPAVNENALFLHATKYHFQDLKLAHQNMKDMANMAKQVQKTTADNIAKRNDPVSVSPGATGAKPDPSNFGTATEYLRSLKG